MNKEVLIHAIKGRGFLSIEDSERLESLGLAYFSGDQHRIKFDWYGDKLEALEACDLREIYERLDAPKVWEPRVKWESVTPKSLAADIAKAINSAIFKE